MDVKVQSLRVMATGRRKELPLTFDDRRTPVITTEDDVAKGVKFLVSREPRFAAVVDRHGIPPVRRVENNLPSLLGIVTEQLISLQAAAAIWRRIEARLHPFEPAVILAHSHDELKQLGLSGAKVRCFHAVSAAVQSGQLDFAALHALSDEAALATLVSLPGIGPWTADIYVLAALGRADVCAAGDLALQIAAQDLFALHERPSAKSFLALAESWRPWRSVAARLLWSHYRGLKGLSQVVN
jgi:DNA-3-methyladenine glycosylase II